MIEDLLTAWEKKLADEHFSLYHDPIRKGITKVNKYYCKFNDIPAILLALRKSFSYIHSSYYINQIFAVLHPYYGMPYIKHKWGGEKERQAEVAAGNPHAKNWQDEAMKLLEAKV